MDDAFAFGWSFSRKPLILWIIFFVTSSIKTTLKTILRKCVNLVKRIIKSLLIDPVIQEDYICLEIHHTYSPSPVVLIRITAYILNETSGYTHYKWAYNLPWLDAIYENLYDEFYRPYRHIFRKYSQPLLKLLFVIFSFGNDLDTLKSLHSNVDCYYR